jgi:hypothetical protein
LAWKGNKSAPFGQKVTSNGQREGGLDESSKTKTRYTGLAALGEVKKLLQLPDCESVPVDGA